MSFRVAVVAIALAINLGCLKKSELFCDEDTPCQDPERPFCDLNGDFPASEGIGRTCIPDPFAGADAGTPDASPVCVREIVFTRSVSGQVDVWRVGADGLGLRNITNSPAEDRGNTHAIDSNVTYVVSDRTGEFDLFAFVEGSSAANRTNTPTDDEIRPVLSHDEQYLAFMRPRNGSASDFDLYTIRVDGAADTPLAATADVAEVVPTWSPDGQRLAYVRIDFTNGTFELRVVSSSGQADQFVASDIADAVWQPEPGAFVAVSLETAAGYDLATVDMRSGPTFGQVQNLTNTADENDFPQSWSPDGASVLFTSDRRGNADIYRIDRDGSGLTRLTFSPGDDFRAAYSPDGSQIAFVSNRSGEFELYVMDADGSNERLLAGDIFTDALPAWTACR